MTREYKAIALLFVVGAIIRLYFALQPGIWIDEALYWHYLRDLPRQEFVPIAISRLLGFTSVELLRVPFVVFGSLSILLPIFVMRKRDE